MKFLPIYYYPTTVFLVDDDRFFLKTLVQRLDKDNLYAYSDNPLKVLEILATQVDKEDALAVIEEEEMEEEGQYAVQVDFPAYTHIIFSPHRFERVSVVIVDYGMPALNGIDFSRKLKAFNPYLKIILLTGEAEAKTAVEAFNQGIIDRYVEKDMDSVKKLKEYIKELSEAYLFSMTHNIRQFLVQQANPLLSEKFLFDLLTHYTKEFDIVEYYLLDNRGSYLLFNRQGESFVLVIKTEADLEYYTTVAIENEASEALIKALESRQKFPLLITSEDKYKPVDTWEECLQEALPVPHYSNLFYAFVSNYQPSDQREIIPFKAVLPVRLVE